LPRAKIIASSTLYALRSKFLLLFFPSAIESIDLSEFDLVISTGSIFSKGLVLRPKTYHINYCHSPTRQVWDLSHEAISNFQFPISKKILQHLLRIWDRLASTRVDQFIANSEHVRARIKKYYRRDAEVIYPPVTPPIHISSQPPFTLKGGAYLIVARLYKHKNIDIAIRAFNKLGWELVIAGTGPEYSHLKALAGPTVRLIGSVSDDTCDKLYAYCQAFIMPQEEDFGIAAIEAMSHGKPILALRRGGALEYIEEGVNGLFFDDAHEAVLADGVRRLREIKFDSEKIKASVEQFSWQKFQSSFSNIINQIAR